MTNEITNAVVTDVAEEVATETAKNSWGFPELMVFGFALLGAAYAGKKAYGGIKWGINKLASRKEIKAETIEEAPVVDIQDCKEVVEDKKKK